MSGENLPSTQEEAPVLVEDVASMQMNEFHVLTPEQQRIADSIKADMYASFDRDVVQQDSRPAPHITPAERWRRQIGK